MRGLTLGGVALLAGCLQPQSVDCPGGVVCPGGTTCARAPVYCAPPEQIAACDGKNLEDFDRCDFGKDDAGQVIDGACRAGACFACTNDLAGCGAAGWQPMNSGTTATLADVWVGGPALAYAVGGDLVLSYDGFNWASSTITDLDTVNTGAMLVGVWGSDPSNVYIASSAGDVYKAEAGVWREVETTTYAFTALDGSGPNDVIAVGDDIVHRFDGTRWTPTELPGRLLKGVWARSGDDVLAVGYGGLVMRYTSAWQPMASGVTTQLNAVFGDAARAFAIGAGNSSAVNTTTVLRLEGDAWVPGDVTDAGSRTFFGIWATDSEVIAVGEGAAVARSTDGIAWTTPDLPYGDLKAIHGSDSRIVFAVGVGGTILRYTGN
jgi:hypothetical protein